MQTEPCSQFPKPPYLEQPEIHALCADYTSTAGCLGPAWETVAEAFLQRIQPEKWPLEWGLPVWLGKSWELEMKTWRALALVNLLGLTHIRIQDELADSILPPDQRATAAGFATLTLHLALQHLFRLIPPGHAFWDAATLILRNWADTQGQRRLLAPEGRALSPQARLELARRGEPIKITALAACILADRQDLWPALDASLQHIALAEVLLDHATDWETDLVTGQANAFLATAGLPSGVGNYDAQAVRRQMLERLLDPHVTSAYFAVAQSEIEQATRSLASLHCPPMTAYLEWFGRHLQETEDAIYWTLQHRLAEVKASLFRDFPNA